MNNIKLFCMDVDGTLTDGKIYMGAEGEVFKSFNIKDGLGIHDLLIKNEIIPVVVTGRKSKIVENRCMELEIQEIHQGIKDKVELINRLCDKYQCSLQEVAYIGDDLNDLPCIELVNQNGGLTAAPSDAEYAVKENVSYVTNRAGGNGAVRDFVNYILKK